MTSPKCQFCVWNLFPNHNIVLYAIMYHVCLLKFHIIGCRQLDKNDIMMSQHNNNWNNVGRVVQYGVVAKLVIGVQ